MKLDDTTHGQKVLTESGRYLENWFDGFKNELGHQVQVDYDEKCQLLNDWPVLREKQDFQVVTWTGKHPQETILLKMDNGFRFKLRLSNYKIIIPFLFESTDVRVKTAKACWTCPSNIIRQMMTHFVWLEYDLMPTLHSPLGWKVVSQ